MRELILKRIEEIKDTIGKDVFGRPNRKGNLPYMAKFDSHFDFSKLSDEELLEKFELVVMYSYRQR